MSPTDHDTTLKTTTLGANGPSVASLGLGAMGMSPVYGDADEDESIATLHAAIDAGMNLLDTGDFYGAGHNELLIARALRDRPREDVVLSVKFGAQRDPAGAFHGFDGSPNAVRSSLAQTLVRLGVDHVDVYRPARLDPSVPIEETVGAIAEMVQAGWVRHIGLSEVGADTIRRAAAVHPIVDLQIEYSLMSRSVEREILPVLRELGIGMTAYGVLSRGLLSGHWRPERELAAGDWRAESPRFQGENLQHNLQLVERLRALADERGVSVAQLAIAWVSAQGDDIVPVIGARTRERLQEALGATGVTLTADDVAALEAAVPDGETAGERYPEHGMASLDSER